MNTITHLREDGVHGNLLLEEPASEVHLGGDITPVNLDLADVSRLLPQFHEAHLNCRRYTRRKSRRKRHILLHLHCGASTGPGETIILPTERRIIFFSYGAVLCFDGLSLFKNQIRYS